MNGGGDSVCLIYIASTKGGVHSYYSPYTKGQMQTVASQEREKMQRQGRGSQETAVQPGDRILVQSKHRTGSLGSSAELKLPTNGRCSREKVTV